MILKFSLVFLIFCFSKFLSFSMDIEEGQQPRYVVGVVRNRILPECHPDAAQNLPIGLVENIFNAQGPDGFVNRYVHEWDDANFIYRRINLGVDINNQISNSSYHIIFGILCNHGESIANALKRVVGEHFRENRISVINYYNQNQPIYPNPQHETFYNPDNQNGNVNHTERMFLTQLLDGTITPIHEYEGEIKAYSSSFFGVSRWDYCRSCTIMITRELLNQQNGVLSNINRDQNPRALIQMVLIGNSMVQTDRAVLKESNFFAQVFNNNIPPRVHEFLQQQNINNLLPMYQRARYYGDRRNAPHNNNNLQLYNWFSVTQLLDYF
jgi:hypothetical protein